MNIINVLVIGNGSYQIYARALLRGMSELKGVHAEAYYWDETFDHSRLPDVLKKAEYKFTAGLIVNRINEDILNICREKHPDLVFLYSPRVVRPETVMEIKRLGIRVFSYSNDDPFSSYYPGYFWRYYKGWLKLCDINYVYRLKNIEDVERTCGRKPELLRSYYLKDQNYPCQGRDRIPNIPDVLFLGHDENDERKEYLATLAGEGIQVGLPRKDYEKSMSGIANIHFLDQEWTKYNQYLCSCKIPLVFLSKINHDTYTRRCFEIPAAGAMLFAPYNEDLAGLYEEDREAVYYHDKKDFIDKVCYYLNHADEREAIAKAGRVRLLKDGHEVRDRAAQVIEDFRNHC